MLLKYKIENLRDELYLMIMENEEYSQILIASKKLDELIVKYILMESN